MAESAKRPGSPTTNEPRPATREEAIAICRRLRQLATEAGDLLDRLESCPVLEERGVEVGDPEMLLEELRDGVSLAVGNLVE